MPPTPPGEIEKLEQGIAALEAQRALLGDAVVDSMIGAIREKLGLLRAQRARGGEQRKQVSVLFGDLSGFTAASEALDAEDVREQINAVWARLDAVIAEHGGLLDKHIGDEVMALWGVESSREDDPERAVRAALGMQAALAEFCQETGTSLSMRAGINTGPVMLGTVGSTAEFTAMGDTVNLASRLQHAAPVGGVLVAHSTYRQVRGVFDVQPREPLVVKGKVDPVQTYVVLQAKPRAFRMRTRGVEGVETRMVGRAAELDQLQKSLRQVIDTRRLSLVSVSGEAGVGKSRLLYEFQNLLELIPETVQFFRGRATEEMHSMPYALLRDILAFRFEIADSDPMAAARAKLERGIVRYLPDDPEALMKAHFIGHLIGLDFSTSHHLSGVLDDPRQIRSRAFHYFVQFLQGFIQESQAAAGVLFLDDLHWADDGSLDALAYLKQAGQNLPLLLICLMRPALFEQRPGWSSDLRLDILPLSTDECQELVDEIFKKALRIPQELRELLVDGAEGNPFYLEELVKMLIDQKVILPGEQAWKIEPARLASVRVPATLTGVLQARLDHLPPAELEILQRASVVGRVFWDKAVAALSESDQADGQPEGALETLRSRELVYRRQVSAFAGASEYVFKHTILREVTYDTVLKRVRRAYHARVADWLVEVSGERSSEYAGLIAEHYDRAEDPAQAAHWYALTGDGSLARSAFGAAARYYARSLELMGGEDPAYSALARQLGETHLRQGDLPAARRALQTALEAARSPADRAAALAIQAELATEAGDYPASMTLLEEAVPLARSAGDRATLCRALFALGSVRWRMGKQDEARTVFLEQVALARALGDIPRELSGLNRMGAVALRSGDLAEAERLWQDVYQRATASGNRERAMAASNNLGSVASMRRDFRAAHDYTAEALRQARQLGIQQTVALTLVNLAETNIHLGRLEEARAGLGEGLRLAIQLGMQPRVLGAVIFFANLAHAEGNTKRALALWGLARRQPAWNADLQRELEASLAAWALPDEEVQAGLAAGAELNWEETLKELG